MMLENLSSLFESLLAVDQNSHDVSSVESLDDLIPSLRKIRKLSGMLQHILFFFWYKVSIRSLVIC